MNRVVFIEFFQASNDWLLPHGPLSQC